MKLTILSLSYLLLLTNRLDFLCQAAPIGASREAKQVVIQAADDEERDAKLAILNLLASQGAPSDYIDELLGDPEKFAAIMEASKSKVIKEYVFDDKIINDGSMKFIENEHDGKILEAGRIQMSEEDALGLSFLCRIHTFAPDRLDQETRGMLSLWLRNWASLGLRPKILRRQDASVFMMKFLPPSYGSDLQWFETDAFIRWMTLFSQGGGVMTDYDVMGMSHDLSLVDPKQCYNLPPQAQSHEDLLGSLVIGTRAAINDYIQNLILIGHEENEARRATNQKLMITDKLLAKKHAGRLFGHLHRFTGLMAMTPSRILEEARQLGVDLKRVDWTNELLKMNALNRNRIEIVVPQDTVLRAHPLRQLLEAIKCPALGGTIGWKPTMPSSLGDIETVLPVPEATCHVGQHYEGSHYSELKPIDTPKWNLGRRPKKESESKQRRKLILVLEDPVISAWNRIGAKRPLQKSNPITRYFFGDQSEFLNQETFDYRQFNSECAALISKLEQEDGLVVILLDPEHTGKSGETTRLVLEYALGFQLTPNPTENASPSEQNRKAPSLKMDRSWRGRFEDENQADAIFYVIARAHFERRARQAAFMEKQLVASTSEIERMPVKIDL